MKWIGKHLQEILLFLLLAVVVFQQVQIAAMNRTQKQTLKTLNQIQKQTFEIDYNVNDIHRNMTEIRFK